MTTDALPKTALLTAGKAETDTTTRTRTRSNEDDRATYSIDELAAKTKVASRTIRFYQARGVLDKPRRSGRKALYTDDHVERLELIARLQDRGMRIRGIKQLLARRDSDAAVSEWLGLSDRLSAPWSNDHAKALEEAEMTALIGDRPAGTLATIVRVGLAERRDDPPNTFFVPSQGLLDVALRLMDAGLSLETLAEIEPILRDGLSRAAEGVVDYFVAESGFTKSGDEDKLTAALDALRSQGGNAVSIIFAQEIERTLRALIDSGDRKSRGNRRARRRARRRKA